MNADYEMTEEMVRQYGTYLRRQERSRATVEKYLRDLRGFSNFLGEERRVDKDRVIAYKQTLAEKYKLSSANSMLAALNGFFSYAGWQDCRVRQFSCQRRLFCGQERELGKEEYLRLLKTARAERNDRLCALMQTVCSTGIRVSELKFITAEAVGRGRVSVRNKGKEREIILPGKLKKLLTDYCAKKKIVSGSIFITRNGNPLNRSNIWSEMKRLCRAAGVEPGKVFPHNLRHLFARTYYRVQRDVMNLADILGHSSVETTRRYTVTSPGEWERKFSRLGLLL